MTDEEYKKQKARTQKYIDKWYRTLGLNWFRVDIVWSRDRDTEHPDTAARANSQWQYKRGDVTFFLPVLAENEDEVVEETVIHEFCHILLSGLWQLVGDHNDVATKHINEYTTELITNALVWAREAGQNDAKKKKKNP